MSALDTSLRTGPAPGAESETETETVQRYPDDADLLSQVMAVYKPECRYLLSAGFERCGEPSQGGRVSVRGRFRIPESCYIADTGHFNAVEFNICYNQMIYFTIAKAVKEAAMWPLAQWNLAQFYHHQLPDMFITDYRATFRRHMRGREFWGELDVVDAMQRDGGNGPLTILSTLSRFGEDKTPSCRGEVKIVLRTPPGLG
ncbi:MAG TPA: FcoT family thioesterase [Actinocrinis sp.]|nr:FcoT family thioesterase [Actinocrinis sp.]